MKSGKSVANGTNGGRVCDIMIKGRSHASRGLEGGKGGGSLELAPSVVGETHEPFPVARSARHGRGTWGVSPLGTLTEGTRIDEPRASQ